MRRRFDDPRHIVITGASSGIGKALAQAYAAPGRTLSLTGRDMERLHTVAQEVRSRGARTEVAALDVTEEEALARWLEERDSDAPIDLLIANAGISRHVSDFGEIGARTREVFETNITGVLNTVLPLLPRMLERDRGQIAVMASLAGLINLPHAPAYSASKACVRAYAESLRMTLAGTGVGVTSICPGFIRTPLTDRNRFRMPFLMEVDEAADVIVKGLARDKARIAFPGPMIAGVRLSALLPYPLFDRLVGRARRAPDGA
ncbi:SDR family NAD(P)-dependent oxidoreductase [Futiania mangrovi]|uniref:SDR family NAD(P)-dependent oxidoreductase n=1 Tax=Futiania mangrovi TaxID=2959716 RepID=A0A9J6P9Q1_9PROT|nr:SDR family NAD(P)-dependent oxidoreductase [Futiania mangrovii]MCP1335645.1 SDR family NAD(P)-dependent oxidoreductase [Futiania mangrovii]